MNATQFQKSFLDFLPYYLMRNKPKELDCGEYRVISPGGVLQLIVEKSDAPKLVRIVVDVDRLSYDDEKEMNSDAIRNLGESLGLNLVNVDEIFNIDFASFITFHPVNKKGVKESKTITLALINGLLFEISRLRDGTLDRILIEDVLEAWKMMQPDIPVNLRSFATDDLQTLICGPYGKYSWVSGLRNPAHFAIDAIKGFENWGGCGGMISREK
jgi:hypothetical protein